MSHRYEQKKTDVSQHRCEIGCQKCLFFSLHDPIWTKIRIISNTSGKFQYRTQRMRKKFFNEGQKVTKDVFLSMRIKLLRFFKHLNYICTINLELFSSRFHFSFLAINIEFLISAYVLLKFYSYPIVFTQ
jgi:hypothetical protein